MSAAGRSWGVLAWQQPVAALLLERLPVTLSLTLSAALHAVPGYVVAQILVVIFALARGLAGAGYRHARAPADGGIALLIEHCRHLALPVLALTLHQLCFMALLVCAGLLMQMSQRYVTAAMARPVRRRRPPAPCAAQCHAAGRNAHRGATWQSGRRGAGH